MLFGAHTSIAGGINEAPLRAKKIGSEVFQIFSRSPRGQGQREISVETIQKFQKACQKFNFSDYYIHTPYYINLASANNRIYYGSIAAIRRDLEIGSKIGARYVMTHLGSARDLGHKKSIEIVSRGIEKILADYEGQTQFLIEMSAGSGEIIGSKFEEIAVIIKKVEATRGLKNKIGVCFDTAHAFASGYDLRTKEKIKKVLGEFEKILGLGRLKLIHANDSKSELGSRVDRHANLGRGKIGLECFHTLVNYPYFKNINMIIETPGTKEDDQKNLNILKELRGS